MLQPYEVIWWDDPQVDCEPSFLCWVTGGRTKTVCRDITVSQHLMNAAVMAVSPEDAKAQIISSYIDEVILEWFSIEPQPFGWSPFDKEMPRTPDCPWSQRPH